MLKDLAQVPLLSFALRASLPVCFLLGLLSLGLLFLFFLLQLLLDFLLLLRLLPELFLFADGELGGEVVI